MTKDEIFKKVQGIICKVLSKEEAEVDISKNLIEDLGAESIDIMTLLIEFEDVFEKQIPDEDAMNLKTVGNIVDYIESKLAG